jgi:hypothetical protein
MTTTVGNDVISKALAGIYRSKTTFFRISEAGIHEKVSVSDILRSLGMSYYHIAELFKSYPFPDLRYQSESMNAKEESRGKPKGRGPLPMSAAEREEKRLQKEEAANSRRYALVETRSGKHGVFDDHDGRVVSLFHTKAEAMEELERMRTGRSCGGRY